MRLRSHMAVAVGWAGGCSSDVTPSLGTSICCRCGPKKQTKQNKTKSEELSSPVLSDLLWVLLTFLLVKPSTLGVVLPLDAFLPLQMLVNLQMG